LAREETLNVLSFSAFEMNGLDVRNVAKLVAT